ncbi:hypothetical protein DFP73DRAFT_600704 [Morchella snyderi]|nr:hypothetical protein DFP73DRAFT_600704 [Morchella snyderi]
MPQPPSRAESSRHAQKMPRNDSHRQKSGTISRGKWSSSQRHARSSQEVPSTFSQESNRGRATASKSQRREPDIGEEASEYEKEFQRHSQIDLQLHGERSLAKDGRLNARHFTSSPLSSPPRDSQSHRQSSKYPESVYDDPAGSSQIFPPRAFSRITSLGRQKSRTHQRESTPSSQKSRSDRQIPDSSHQNSESSSATPAAESTESGKGRVFRMRGLKPFDMSYRFILEKAGWNITKETLFVNPHPSVMEMPVMIRKAWDSATEGSEHTQDLTMSVSAQIRYYHQRARSHIMEKAKSFVISSYGPLGMSPEKLKDRVDYLLTTTVSTVIRNIMRYAFFPVEWHFSAPQIPRFIVYCYYKTNRGIAVNHPEFEGCINHTFICLVSTVLYHALRVHVIGGSSWKNGVFNKDYCGSEFLLLHPSVIFPLYPSFSQSIITSPAVLAYSHAVLAYSHAVLAYSHAVLAYPHAILAFHQCTIFCAAVWHVPTPSWHFPSSPWHLHILPGLPIILLAFPSFRTESVPVVLLAFP